MWVCVTPWPWRPFINCHITSPHLRVSLCRAHPTPRIIFPLTPKQQQALSCCLAFPQASSSQLVQPQARPHNRRAVFVDSPFCPLCLVPLADLALQQIPGEGQVSEWAEFCISNWLVSCTLFAERCCSIFSAESKQPVRVLGNTQERIRGRVSLFCLFYQDGGLNMGLFLFSVLL